MGDPSPVGPRPPPSPAGGEGVYPRSDDPAEIRRARDKAKACGELAAAARKVALITPAGRAKPLTDAGAAGFTAPATPMAAQAEHARRALEKLKGGRRGRL